MKIYEYVLNVNLRDFLACLCEFSYVEAWVEAILRKDANSYTNLG